MTEYKSWQQILNTTDAKLNTIDFQPGSDSKGAAALRARFRGAL